MKRLIDEKYESYNKLGSDVDEQFHKLIRQFIKDKVQTENISAIDLEYVLTSAVAMECIYQRAYRACNIRIKEREEESA